jgi:predicted RNA-binding Zn-ribbon protein involved in translation (DUF1610 family)
MIKITEEQYNEAVKTIKKYHQQKKELVADKCSHRGAWMIANKEHPNSLSNNFYCPDCKLAFTTTRCEICNGTGEFYIKLKTR